MRTRGLLSLSLNKAVGWWCRSLASICFALGLSLYPAYAAMAASIPWSKQKFTLITKGMRLDSVLHELGAHNGFPVVVSNKVSDIYIGALREVPSAAALSDLARLYKLAWYYNGQALYVYRADEVSYQLLTASTAKTSDLFAQLGQTNEVYCRASILPDTYLIEVWGVPICLERFSQMVKSLEAQSPYAEQNQETVEVFPLRYANAVDTNYRYRQENVIVPGVISILREMMSGRSLSAMRTKESAQAEQGAPMFAADARQNAVIVRDRKNNMPLYTALIKQIDIKQPLIEVSVAIIDVDAEDLNALGIDWSASAKIGGGSVSFNSTKGLGTSNFSTIIANTGSFMVRLNALEQHSKAKVLSRPSVVTLNNVQAILDRNITFYTKLSSEKMVKLESVAAGSLMRVTPRIVDEDGKKQMMLTLNIEDGKQVSPMSELEPLPQIQKSEIATQASLLAGQSLLLGGFIRDEQATGQRKIPLLGDLPVLGNFFRSTNHTNRSVVRLFLIKAEPL